MTSKCATVVNDSTRNTAQDEWDIVRIPMPSDTISGHRWLELLHKWSEYLRVPSSENAVGVYDAVPKGKLDSIEWKLYEFVADSLYNSAEVLTEKIAVNDRQALRIAFLFDVRFDGDFSETMDIYIGRIIKTNPLMFLQEAKNHEHLIDRWDALVGNFGPDLVDMEDQQEDECRVRVAALKSVQIDSLKNVRDKCIAELSDQCE